MPRPRSREKTVERQQEQSFFNYRDNKLLHKVGLKDAQIRVYNGWAETACCGSIYESPCRQPVGQQDAGITLQPTEQAIISLQAQRWKSAPSCWWPTPS
jgi:hypothetical protein